MADSETPEVEPQETEERQPEEMSVDEKIDAKIGEIEQRFKSEISGLNRRNSELEKELDEERKAHMSDKERLEYEKQQRETELAEREKRLAEAERRGVVTNALAERKIDLSVQELMTQPKDAEETAAWVGRFEAAVNAEVEKRVSEALASGKAPRSSGGTGVTLKPLESFEDGRNASPEEFQAYLEQTLT